MTPEGLDELRHIVELQEFYTSRNDPAHIKEMDDQFHNLICTISGRQVIADTLRPLHRKIQNYRRSSMADTARARAATQEHRAIFEAMAAGDAERARALTVEHITLSLIHISSGRAITATIITKSITISGIAAVGRPIPLPPCTAAGAAHPAAGSRPMPAIFPPVGPRLGQICKNILAVAPASISRYCQRRPRSSWSATRTPASCSRWRSITA